LVGLLLAWSAEGALADPSPPASGDQDSESGLSSYLVLGAVAAGFAATYALLLSGSGRSHAHGAPAAADADPVGVPPQPPGAPGEAEPGGGTGSAEDPPTAADEGPAISSPSLYPAPTSEAPEPGTLYLVGTGAAALLALRLRRRSR